MSKRVKCSSVICSQIISDKEKETKYKNAPPPLESAIVTSILKYLKGLPGCYAEKTHGSAWGNAGKPDIWGCFNGRSFVLEVKRPGLGRLSELQKVMLARWAAAGAISGVVTSVDETKRLLLKGGKSHGTNSAGC